MTENKPIMIDGVDVSGCEYYQYGMCTATKDNYGDCSSDCKDYDMKDCYYKQLARKTQECEELKKQYNCYACDTCKGKEDYINLKRHYENAIKSLHNKHAELDQLKVAKEQAEQKLKKIAEIANGVHDMWINKTQYTDVYNLAEYLLKCELSRIINEFDEIDEVK